MRREALKESAINQHTDHAVDKLHDDNSTVMNRINQLEDKLEQHRKEVKDDLRELFSTLSHFKDLLQKGWWRLASLICALIIMLMGAVFTWLWDKEKDRESLQRSNAMVLGETMGVQKEMSNNINLIREAVNKGLDSQNLAQKEHGREFREHLKEGGHVKK